MFFRWALIELRAYRRNEECEFRVSVEVGEIMLKGKRVLFFLLLSLSSSAWAATEVRDWAKLRERFGLRRYYRQDSRLKIAILDNGFLGFDPKKQLLPNSAELIPSASGIPPLPSSHGLAMAQILWSMTAKDEAGPHFYLLNTNGFTNLKAAIQFVVDQGIHIVLYSQVWTFGGNLDGTGFINALVQRALDAGVIWIDRKSVV